MADTTTQSKYTDVRHDLWRETFAAAPAYRPYVADGPEKHRTRWEKMDGNISLTAEQENRVKSFQRRMNLLCYSGIWCGDCVRQGPMLDRIAQANDLLDLRFVERVDGSPVAEELRINGALKVPVVVVLSEDFYEISRVGDRMLSVYRKKAKRELGPACEVGLIPPEERELIAEVDEWLDHLERAQWILRLSPHLRERYGD